MLGRLTPNLMVSSVDDTIAFYVTVLGFTCLTTVPENDPYDWALLECDGVQIMFQSQKSITAEFPRLQEKPQHMSGTLYIDCSDVQDRYNRYRDYAVVDLHDTFYGTKEFTIADINGYLLTFAQSISA